jgi:hypothetical protein
MVMVDGDCRRAACRDSIVIRTFRGYARVEAWLVAGAALLAGATQFLEKPLTQFLRTWVDRRDLPSILFAVSLSVLVVAVCYAWDRQISKIRYAMRGWLVGDVQRAVVGVCTFVVIFIGHIAWLGFADAMDRAVNYQPNVDPFRMIGSVFLSVVIFGLLVGFCINRAIAGAPPSQQLNFSETESVDPQHDYRWLDFAPRRPYRSVHEECRARIVPVFVIFTATGLVVGCLLWRDQWIGTGILGALLGLLAAGLYGAAVNWGYRNHDGTAPVEELVYRRAFVKQAGDAFRFVVVTEDGSPTGKVLIDVPWEDVAEFSRARYADVFGISGERVFSSRDWSVIIMVPIAWSPKLVSETIGTLQDDYATLAGLSERFDPRARSRFMQARKPAPTDVGSKRAGTIPKQL